MQIKTVKTGISLPREEFVLLERLRMKIGISRSELFREAVSYWLKSMQEKKRVKQYMDGYRKHPELISEIKAIELASAEAFIEEDLV